MDTAERPAWGSACMDDDSFVSAFEACLYPPDRFRHLDHVRLAWIYTRRLGADAAEDRMAGSILRFARSLGHDEKFHATITTAWMRLVRIACSSTPGIDDFDRFLSSHPWLADKGTLDLFYSQTALSSQQARQEWIEPDIRPLTISIESLALHSSLPIR
jgi:hypothetical protein